MKMEEKIEAKKLRSCGLSLNEIAKKLNVSKSSVSGWCRDVKLTVEQTEALLAKNPAYNRQCKGAKAVSDKYSKLREQYREAGKIAAMQQETLHIAGCMLYWGEGFKQRNTCGICNTDINLLKLFKRFIDAYFDVPPIDFNISIQFYSNNGISQKEIEDYWLHALNLPRVCLRKHSIDAISRLSKRKRKTQPYGTCRLTIGRTDIVQHIFGAIQQYGDFNSDYCLY